MTSLFIWISGFFMGSWVALKCTQKERLRGLTEINNDLEKYDPIQIGKKE